MRTEKEIRNKIATLTVEMEALEKIQKEAYEDYRKVLRSKEDYDTSTLQDAYDSWITRTRIVDELKSIIAYLNWVLETPTVDSNS